MKKSVIFLDAFILLAVSTLFVVGLDQAFKLFKGKEKPDSPIILAVTSQKSDQEIREILQKNPDALDHRNEQGRTPLMRICNANLKDPIKLRHRDQYVSSIVRLILDQGVELEAKDEDGWTALTWASWSNLPSVVSVLVEGGADLNVADKNGNTPLSIARNKGNEDVAMILSSPLLQATATKKPIEEIEELIKQSGVLEARDGMQRTPLMLICNVNMKEGQDLREKDRYLSTISEIILDQGIPVDDRDLQGMSALTWAASSNLKEVSKVLLKRGADINAKDKKGRTPLMHAAENNHRITTLFLAESGAEMEATDEEGLTALMLAAIDDSPAAIEALLSAGANTEHVNKKGQTALQLAKSRNNKAAISALTENAAGNN